MKFVHLFSALIVSGLTIAAVLGADAYARGVESVYVHALAPKHVPLNVTGSALQKIAFQQSDLLPIYGASEVLNQPSVYQPSQFFANYPTGFTTFEVAKGGVATIIVAEALASIGPDLQGKKVVISFTPGQFTAKMMGVDNYAGLFSRLHANELIFSTQLSLETKQLAAKRMVQYPKTLETDPVLKFALERLADGSLPSTALYYLAFPLGKLQTLILEFQDHYETITYIQSQKKLDPNIPHQPATLNWNALQARAKQEQIPFSNNNPFGFDNTYWTQNFKNGFKAKPNGSSDQAYVTNLQNSAEWTDLEILLRILKELGAQPLLLGRPYNTDYYNATGISAQARQAFYDRMHQTANRFGAPYVDFEECGDVRYFGVDPAPHMAREGWVYVDQVLDEFYHGANEQSLGQGCYSDPLLSSHSDRTSPAVR